MSQYKSTREEIVDSIISSQQLAAQSFEEQQRATKLQWPNEGLTRQLKEALQKVGWLKAHQNKMTMREDLAWKGDKLYVPATLRINVLQQSPDPKPAGHFRTRYCTFRQLFSLAINESG